MENKFGFYQYQQLKICKNRIFGLLDEKESNLLGLNSIVPFYSKEFLKKKGYFDSSSLYQDLHLEVDGYYADVSFLQEFDDRVRVWIPFSFLYRTKHQAFYEGKNRCFPRKLKKELDRISFIRFVVELFYRKTVELNLILPIETIEDSGVNFSPANYLSEINIDFIWDNKLLEKTTQENYEEFKLFYLNPLKPSDLIPEAKLACKSCKYNYCWGEQTILKVWNLWKSNKTSTYLKENKIYLSDLTTNDIEPSPESKRQIIQLDFYKNKVETPFFDKPRFYQLSKNWKFPLHCIDFETALPFLPLYKGMNPKEYIAFQFSHHTISQNGEVNYVGEFLFLDSDSNRDENPNIVFVRKIKEQLECDEGSIFSYGIHESNVIKNLILQLDRFTSAALPDKKQLISFLKTLLPNGKHALIDLHKIMVECYYHPKTLGSNSLKDLISAINSNANLNPYATLAVNDGLKALTLWINHYLNQKDQPLKNDFSTLSKLDEELRAYCRQDSFSMTQLIKEFF